MKGQFFVVAAVVGFFCGGRNVAAEEDERWVWSSAGGNRRERAFRDVRSERFRDEVYARAERDREPTTKRPAPGAPLNEEIDDYPEGDDKNPGTRQYPFGFNGGQIGAGGGGFNNYPGVGGYGGNPLANGILVGPGGPTGIIGRPQQYFPGTAGGAGGYPGVYGQPGFGNGGLGFPQQQQPGGIGFGGFGQPQGYPQAQQGAQYPGGYYNGGGQFPAAGQYPGSNQFGAAQFPGANGGQYPAVNGQYPGGSQYPGSGQYPGASQYPGGGPIYTEGYGLFSNGYAPQGGVGFPQTPFGGFNGFGTGFDEQNQTKRKLQVEEKSRSIGGRAVDDKIGANAKKST